MIYTKDKQLERIIFDLKVDNTKIAIDEIKDILNADINEAIRKIKLLRNQYMIRKKIPEWLRKLIYYVIYNYLKEENSKYTQSEILKKMNLSADIFTKNWDMISPYKKIKMESFNLLNIRFQESEIESNEGYLAMIHYLLQFTSIPTDTFVDMVGHMGIVECVCAQGYERWFMNKYHSYYNVLFIEFQKAMKNTKKVYKELNNIKNEISGSGNKYDKANRISKLLSDYWLSLMLEAKKMENEKDTSYTESIKAAQYFFIRMFSPMYWQRSYLVQHNNKNTYGKPVIENELVTNDIKYKYIDNFLDDDNSDDFIQYGKLIRKLDVFDEDSILNIIKEIKKKNNRCLLYLEMPKSLNEYERFAFSKEEYVELMEELIEYKGEWILVWKKYIDISENTEGKIEFGYTELLTILRKKEDIWVFKYRDKRGNNSKSIVFITNINFEAIEYVDFDKLYDIGDKGYWGNSKYAPTLLKQSLEEFAKHN